MEILWDLSGYETSEEISMSVCDICGELMMNSLTICDDCRHEIESIENEDD